MFTGFRVDFLSLLKTGRMKGNVMMILSVSTGLAIGLIIVRRINTRQMLTQVADEGYETAHDILYPRHLQRGKNLRYGPVLPLD